MIIFKFKYDLPQDMDPMSQGIYSGIILHYFNYLIS
jgi:hypothetical protein